MQNSWQSFVFCRNTTESTNTAGYANQIKMQQDSMDAQAAHVKEHTSSVLRVSRKLKSIDEPNSSRKNAPNVASTPSPSPAPAPLLILAEAPRPSSDIQYAHNMIYGEFSVRQSNEHDLQVHTVSSRKNCVAMQFIAIAQKRFDKLHA